MSCHDCEALAVSYFSMRTASTSAGSTTSSRHAGKAANSAQVPAMAATALLASVIDRAVPTRRGIIRCFTFGSRRAIGNYWMIEKKFQLALFNAVVVSILCTHEYIALSPPGARPASVTLDWQEHRRHHHRARVGSRTRDMYPCMPMWTSCDVAAFKSSTYICNVRKFELGIWHA